MKCKLLCCKASSLLYFYMQNGSLVCFNIQSVGIYCNIYRYTLLCRSREGVSLFKALLILQNSIIFLVCRIRSYREFSKTIFVTLYYANFLIIGVEEKSIYSGAIALSIHNLVGNSGWYANQVTAALRHKLQVVISIPIYICGIKWVGEIIFCKISIFFNSLLNHLPLKVILHRVNYSQLLCKHILRGVVHHPVRISAYNYLACGEVVRKNKITHKAPIISLNLLS